jgi:AcrR family transcriptional regulator
VARHLTEDRRRLILDAACELFGTRGYQDTNIADIASRLGMGHGTFYRYFKNKRDIFDAVVGVVLARIDAVTESSNPAKPATLQAHAREVARIGKALYAAFIADIPAARLIFYEAAGLDDEVRARVDATFERFAALTAAYLENGRARGYLRPDIDVPTMSRALGAIVFEGIRRTIRASDPERESLGWIAAYQQLASGLAASRPGA